MSCGVYNAWVNRKIVKGNCKITRTRSVQQAVQDVRFFFFFGLETSWFFMIASCGSFSIISLIMPVLYAMFEDRIILAEDVVFSGPLFQHSIAMYF